MTSPPDDPAARARAAARRAFVLYEGEQVRHRSCGIALAETFGLRSAPYQILRRGGLTGEGECGAVRAGEMVLGEVLGDPDPAGPVTPALRHAVERYRALVDAGLDGAAAPERVCNHLTAPFADFSSKERKAFCTGLASRVAEWTATALEDAGHRVVLPAEPRE